jgi:hypothetical protein
LPQDPFAERNDQAGLFRKRHELCRRDHAEIRIAPADQCFVTAHAFRLRVCEGLIEHFELAPRQGIAERRLQGLPRLEVPVHAGIEQADIVRSRFAGAGSRGPCILEELLHVAAIVGEAAYPDIRVERQAIPANLVDFRESAVDVFRQGLRLRRSLAGRIERGKLVPANSPELHAFGQQIEA